MNRMNPELKQALRKQILVTLSLAASNLTASLLVCGLVSSANAADVPLMPNPELTPGSLCTQSDPDYEEMRYGKRVVYCRRNVSNEMKDRVYDAYGIPRHCRREYTVDHLIPLSIGGSNQFENLWPEHRKIKFSRLHLEDEVFDGVRTGFMTQKQAVERVLEEKTDLDKIPHDVPSRCD